MKLAEMDNERALDAFAEILDPMAEIFTDAELRKAVDENKSYMSIIQLAIKKHKKEIIEILATMEGVPVEEYKCNIFTLPLKLMQIIKDEELAEFFM